jgi:hypothetical protein
LSEEEIGVDSFKSTIYNVLGTEPVPFYFSYHVRLGVK